MCRRHPLQDHGARAAKLTAKAAGLGGATNNKSASDLIQAQIEKLQNSAKGTTDADQDAYRVMMEVDRARADKRKRKSMSSEHLDLASKSGLHASVLSAMMAPDSGEDDDDDSDGDSADSESTSASERKAKKAKKSSKKSSKKDKKEKKEKKEKKSKKDKKEKSEKKESKKRKKKRSRVSDSASHSSQGSSSDEAGAADKSRGGIEF
jgi:hypothetical protein